MRISNPGNHLGYHSCQVTHVVGGSGNTTALHKGTYKENPNIMAHLGSHSDVHVSIWTNSKHSQLISYRLNGTTGGTPVFAQYLKNSKQPKYSVQQINNYPTIGNAVQIISAIIYSWVSDSVLGGRRWPILLFSGVGTLVVPSIAARPLTNLTKYQTISCTIYASLAAWNIAEGWRWACYILIGQGVGMTAIQLT